MGVLPSGKGVEYLVLFTMNTFLDLISETF